MIKDTLSGLSPEVSQVFIRALSNDNHRSMGSISVTQLLDAPQIRILRKKHKVEEELNDRIAMLLGTCLHGVLEGSHIQDSDARAFKQVIDWFYRASQDAGKETEAGQMYLRVEKYLKDILSSHFQKANDNLLFEQTLMMTIDGMEISGTFDLYNKETKTLMDYKLTGVYNFIYPEARLKWSAQLNTYAFMLRQQGFEVNQAKIIAVFKDFSKGKAAIEKGYPQSPIVEIPIELHPKDQMELFLKERVRLHKLAESGVQVDCSAKETWSKSDTWVVKAHGGKRALSGSVSDSLPMAEAFVAREKYKHPKGLQIEMRPGQRGRCESYCPVSSVCPQFKQYVETLTNQSQSE
jgi:hypothetical protein